MFKTKPHKKWTWRSPNGMLLNEIDYILTNKPTQIQSFDLIRNLNYSTDHKMLRCKLLVQIKNNRKKFKSAQHTNNLPTVMGDTARYWEEKFLEPIKKEEGVQKQYNALVTEIQNLMKLIPRTLVKEEEHVSDETRDLLEKRKNLYKIKRTKNIKTEISTISKKINRNISREKKTKRRTIFERCIGKSGALQKAYKELREKTEWTSNLKNKHGRVLSRRPDIINEATTFYKDLYAADLSQTRHTNNYKDSQRSTQIEPTLSSEIAYAIKTQKDGKAPGSDTVTNEVLKSISISLEKPLQLIFDNIMKTKYTPEEWSRSTIILIHKKGDRGDLGNYRPISLMTNLYKIFSKIVLNRLSPLLDENQPREQAGFRRKFSTIDHIQVVTQMVEKCNEYGKQLYMCFIDYTKAFDSLHHDKIWTALEQQGVNQEYVELIRNIYSKCQAKVKLERYGEEFIIQKGVRQGDPLSPKIFSAVLEYVFRHLDWEQKGIKIDGEFLSHLRFADDIVIFAENAAELETMVSQLAVESKNVGLVMNATKTKILTNGEPHAVVIQGTKIEYVTEYTYLGQLISFENCTEREINRRITLAWNKYWGLKEIMKNKEINTSIKRKVYEAAILPCLTYGCQTWSLRRKDEEKIAICQRKMERSILGIRKSDKIKNKIIRSKTKVKDITERIRLLKWKWAGHVCRLENERWTKKVTEWTPLEGKRKKGGQKKRWRDIFTKIAGPDWMTKARNREEWRDLGEAYAKKATITHE